MNTFVLSLQRFLHKIRFTVFAWMRHGSILRVLGARTCNGACAPALIDWCDITHSFSPDEKKRMEQLFLGGEEKRNAHKVIPPFSQANIQSSLTFDVV